ncbi:hypothetical protein [Formosa sp. PL04]|uniref:hypothetical protein n=1 Tax=Formosa sp. PL04 TaxID=3081755 RepID=UPI002981EC29|nr:hypothetical protein [Formosa sp. PL04]MDW5287493.1 hypothetical protein [Formosa sp. PL04]
MHTLKLHHLQIVKKSIMAYRYKDNSEYFNLSTLESYIEFIAGFIRLLRLDIIIERFISESPKDLQLAPQWNGLKNFEVVAKIDRKFIELKIWQGQFYEKKAIAIL